MRKPSGLLREALELNPQDSEARELKERALQERDRLRQVREALSSGQRAMRQGDASAAEREFQRALATRSDEYPGDQPVGADSAGSGRA